MYAVAVEAVETLLKRGETLHITPQNLVEFWNVCTRPFDKNGLGMTPTEAAAEVTRFEALLPLKLDVPDIHQQWRTLVEGHSVKGVNVHDARLVAVCIVHGLTHILTFNDRDFRRYNEINVVHPDAVNSQP
jgi:predicted nucleic acid-binding protein